MPTTVCRSCGGTSSPLRWACPACVQSTTDRLDEIREHAVTLGAAGPACHGRTQQPPAGGGLAALPEFPRDGDPAAVVRSVLDVLHRIARHVRHHRGELGAFRCTIASETDYLRANAEWCAHQLWGHEFVAAVRELHTRTGERAVALVR